jgi:hypothetical protein
LGLFGNYLQNQAWYIISDSINGKQIVDCSKYLGTRIFDCMVLVIECMNTVICPYVWEFSVPVLGSYPECLNPQRPAPASGSPY